MNIIKEKGWGGGQTMLYYKDGMHPQSSTANIPIKTFNF